MISNLFNNLNAVDMWITGSKALPSQLCLFPSSVIFSLTNDLMLIFIYNFHLSDIMACSGLLSEADEWKSSAEITHAEVCVGHFSPIQQRPLPVMNECIFMSSTCLQTHSIMWQSSSGDLYLFGVQTADASVSFSSCNRLRQPGPRLPAASLPGRNTPRRTPFA